MTNKHRHIIDKGEIVVNDVIVLVPADEYDRERGFEWRILTTHNGWQYTGTHALDRRSLAQLRDTINSILKGDKEIHHG